MLAARKGLPAIEADFDPSFTRSDDLFAGREEYRSRIEDCRLGVGREDFARFIFLCIAEFALWGLDSGEVLFRNFKETGGKETGDMVSVLSRSKTRPASI